MGPAVPQLGVGAGRCQWLRRRGGVAAQIEKTGAKALLRSIGILGTCIKEAPEFGGRRRHADAPKP